MTQYVQCNYCCSWCEPGQFSRVAANWAGDRCRCWDSVLITTVSIPVLWESPFQRALSSGVKRVVREVDTTPCDVNTWILIPTPPVLVLNSNTVRFGIIIANHIKRWNCIPYIWIYIKCVNIFMMTEAYSRQTHHHKSDRQTPNSRQTHTPPDLTIDSFLYILLPESQPTELNLRIIFAPRERRTRTIKCDVHWLLH